MANFSLCLAGFRFLFPALFCNFVFLAFNNFGLSGVRVFLPFRLCPALPVAFAPMSVFVALAVPVSFLDFAVPPFYFVDWPVLTYLFLLVPSHVLFLGWSVVL